MPMDKIVDGLNQFQCNIFRNRQQLFESLAKGQSPQALFITCSDSRIDPCLLTQTEPGDLFILRNAGNIVPPFGSLHGGEAATIEYAVSVLKIADIIVCGHSHCGAMAGLLNRQALEELPAVKAWLGYAESTWRIMKENFGQLEGTERLNTTVEENVLVQLENLRTHPSVAAALAREQLKLHGWVYKFETGEVNRYDESAHKFTLLGQPATASTAAR